MAASLYADTPCPACGKSHDLFYHDPTRHPHGAVYQYTCQAAGVVVAFRPTTTPQSIILAPAVAVALTWVSD